MRRGTPGIVSVQPNTVNTFKVNVSEPSNGDPNVAQGFTLVVYHKSWLVFEPGLLLGGVMDDSSESYSLHLRNASRPSMLPVTDDSKKSHPWHI